MQARRRYCSAMVLLICGMCAAGVLWQRFGGKLKRSFLDSRHDVRLIEDAKRLESRLSKVIGEFEQKLKNTKNDLDQASNDLAKTKSKLKVAAGLLVAKKANLQRYPALLWHADGVDTTNGQHFPQTTINLQVQYELVEYRRREQEIRTALERLLSDSEKQADLQREYLEVCRAKDSLDRLQKRIWKMLEGAESRHPNPGTDIDVFTIQHFERELLDAELSVRFLGG